MNAVTGSVRVWLRMEGLAVLVAAVFFYRQMGARWLLFAVLFLAPDLSMLGYLAGSRIGAVAYNVAHSYVLPVSLLIAGVLSRRYMLAPYALIWIAHIGFDRVLGYGLKYP
ncbi:MAG: DUF4260 domain-containing protein, partial [Silvibacterium sp.]